MKKFTEDYNELYELYKEYTSTVSTDGMAISFETAWFMYYLCDKYKFKTLMDRGSGFSSVVLRLYAKKQDFSVTVYSIDDSEIWLEKTKMFLNSKDIETDNLCLWDDFYKTYKGKIKFDFILEDAKKALRVSTPNKLTSFIKDDGVILWDDAKVHSGLINVQADRLSMNRYNVKEYTLDSYKRYAIMTTRRKLKDFEKI